MLKTFDGVDVKQIERIRRAIMKVKDIEESQEKRF
jgi:hypothetical protein